MTKLLRLVMFESSFDIFGSLETIKLYLKITDKALLCNMFDKAMEKSNTPDIDAFTKVSSTRVDRKL